MFFSPSSKDSIRKYLAPVALELALMVGLIIIRPLVGQLVGQFFNIREPQLLTIPLLHPHFGSYCPQSPDYAYAFGSLFQDISMCIAIIGSFAYALLSLGLSIPRDKKKQAQATLGAIVFCIEGALLRASEVVREYTRRLLPGMAAAYSGKTLRARLETIPRHLGFPTYSGVITCLFISMANKLKMITTCLFFFGLGVVVTMAYYHSQSLLTYTHVALSLFASDLTDRVEALFAATTIKLKYILAPLLFFAGLRCLILLAQLSSFKLFFSPKKEARKLWSKASLLVDKDESAILVGDEDLAESDEDADGVALNLNLGDVGEDERRVSSQQQQDKKLSSSTTPLSATSPEFVPRLRSTVPVPAQDSCPSYWALPPPVSVRITAPVKPHGRRGARPKECGNGDV